MLFLNTNAPLAFIQFPADLPVIQDYEKLEQLGQSLP